MINNEFILSKLPMYTGTVEVMADDQSVYDIISGVKSIHKRYANDYDKIAQYFIGDIAEDTCRNVFNFLRRSSFYYVEGEDLQTLRSPSAILATGKVHGIDCKNYALFIGGVLDAINRSGLQDIPYCYRFASDKLFDPTPCHVFVVAFPGTINEMWIDPIPQVVYFDQRLTYYYHTDKNYKTMLQAISGRNDRQQIDDLEKWESTGESLSNGNFVSAALKVLKNIISLGGPNPNDWEGWPLSGEDARDWVLRDGDSVSNEAVNILKFIKAYGITPMLTGGKGIPAVTVVEIADKVRRGGFPDDAQLMLQKYKNTGTVHAPGTPAAKKADQNKLITFGLIGAGVLYMANQKKRVSGIGSMPLLIGAGVAAYFLLQQKPSLDEQLIQKFNLQDTPEIRASLAAESDEVKQGLLDGLIIPS